MFIKNDSSARFSLYHLFVSYVSFRYADVDDEFHDCYEMKLKILRLVRIMLFESSSVMDVAFHIMEII